MPESDDAGEIRSLVDAIDADFDGGDDEFRKPVPPAILVPAVPISLVQFEGWHRPRKQWVRKHQWCDLSRRLVSTLRNRQPTMLQTGLRYLTLPGMDLFDIEALGSLCQELALPLEMTGFLAAENQVRARATTRLFSLTGRGMLTHSSAIFPERLESLGSSTTQAYKDFQQRGPYHVVNIDACGPLAAREEGGTRMVDAVYNIVDYQLNRCSHNWLLFLTTVIQLDSVHATVLETWKRLIRDNVAHEPAFGPEASSALMEGYDDLEAAIDRSSAQDGPGLIRLFSLGFGKWLHHQAQERGWSVKMHVACCYSTRTPGPESANMPSLAFEFVPPPLGRPDPTGLAVIRRPRDGTPPLPPIVRIAKKAGALVDLDDKLERDGALRETMTAEMEALLVSVGYQDVGARYKSWLAEPV